MYIFVSAGILVTVRYRSCFLVQYMLTCFVFCSDELPVQLRLPRAVQEAKTRHELTSLALLGQGKLEVLFLYLLATSIYFVIVSWYMLQKPFRHYSFACFSRCNLLRTSLMSTYRNLQNTATNPHIVLCKLMI